MKIYPAIQYLDTLEKGGSTRPWLVELLTDENVPETYVVKMFTAKQINQQNAVAKEVFGNVLATVFSLPVPDWGLARFTPEFVETLSEEERKRHEQCHKGLRFASKHAEGYTIFGDQLINSKLNDYDMPSVYAFDNLVRNLDRGGYRNKPNLLINDDDYLLIDHELIFPFADDPDNYNDRVIQDFLNDKWDYPYHLHLFHGYLKKRRPSNKIGIFDQFSKSLKKLDPYVLEEAIQFLSENGHSCGNVELITDYLRAIKENTDKFIAILQSQIS